MTMKKILAMLLAVAMLFAFAACGSSSDDDDDDDKKSNNKKTAAAKEISDDDILGKWETSFMLTDFVDAEELANDEGVEEEYIDMYAALYDGIKLDFVMEFDEDGNFSLYVDDVDETMKNIVKTLFTNLYNDGLYAAMIGMTQAEFEEAVEAEGEDYDEYIASTIETLMADEEELDDTCAEMIGFDLAELDVECDYKLEDGKLYLGEDGEFEDDEYIEIEYSDGKIEFVKIYEADATDEEMDMFEGLVLTKK